MLNQMIKIKKPHLKIINKLKFIHILNFFDFNLGLTISIITKKSKIEIQEALIPNKIPYKYAGETENNIKVIPIAISDNKIIALK